VQAASVKRVPLLKGQVKQLKKRAGAAWSSSRSKVVSVDRNGLVMANKKGTAVVTAKKGKKKYRYRITVQSPKLSKKTKQLKLKKSFTLKVKGTSKKFRWTSSNPSVVSVKAKGKNKCKVQAKSNGVAIVSASSGGVELACEVTSGSGNVPPDGITTMYFVNGDVLKRLTKNRTDTAKYISSLSGYGQSAPLYISAEGGDGLENIWSETNNGAVGVSGAKLSEAAVAGTVTKACTWARAVCDSPYHGYDNGHNYEGAQWGSAFGQAKANSPGTGDYCCFSIPLCAYYFAGVNVLGENLGGPDAKYMPHTTLLFYTGDVSFYGGGKKATCSTCPYDSMYLYPRCGFTDVTSSYNNNRDTFEFKAGDVATYGSHAQMIIKGGTRKTCQVAQAYGPSGKKQKNEKGGDQGYELGVGSLYRSSDIQRVWRFTGEGVRLNTVGLTG